MGVIGGKVVRMRDEFHKARRSTPFADGAPYDAHQAYLLSLALQHGITSTADFRTIDPSLLPEGACAISELSPQTLIQILEAVGITVEKKQGPELKPGVHFID